MNVRSNYNPESIAFFKLELPDIIIYSPGAISEIIEFKLGVIGRKSKIKLQKLWVTT